MLNTTNLQARPHLLFYENKFLTSKYIWQYAGNWTSCIGLGMLLIGGIILIISRIQLGKYASTRIATEKDHKLVSQRMYRYIRHPIYLGFLLIFFGFSVSFRSFLFSFILLIALFVLFKHRMDSEEELLKSVFGEEYTSYLKQTKRLIPFLY